MPRSRPRVSVLRGGNPRPERRMSTQKNPAATRYRSSRSVTTFTPAAYASFAKIAVTLYAVAATMQNRIPSRSRVIVDVPDHKGTEDHKGHKGTNRFNRKG